MAADTDSNAFPGGARVRVVAKHASVISNDRVVQCFDPRTGYIWPFEPTKLERVYRFR